MDTTRTHGDRLPRLLSRVLFVVGAAIAGTAAAWLLSTATASADELPVPPVGTGVDCVMSVGVPAARVVPSVGKVAGDLDLAVAQVGDRLPDRTVVGPAPTAPPRASATAPARTGRRSSHTAIRSAMRTRLVPAPATGRASSARVPARAHVAVTPAPARPVPPRPSVPTTVPSPPAGSGDGAGSPGTGGITPVDATGAAPAPALDAVHVMPVTTPTGRLTLGKQPGITPD